MNIGVLGTGVVAKTLAKRLAGLGHAVTLGTRDVTATLARDQPDKYGGPPLRTWLESNPGVKVASFVDCAAHGEIVFCALDGDGSVSAATQAKAQLEGKILVDISNPLDFSKGIPPSLTISNTDSLGEHMQRTLPASKVVKTLNTVNAMMMVNPQALADGDHTMFVAGNDAEAKAEVTRILKDWFGWKDVLDLGDITNARGTEMYLPLWVRLYGTVKTPMFNLKIVR